MAVLMMIKDIFYGISYKKMEALAKENVLHERDVLLEGKFFKITIPETKMHVILECKFDRPYQE